MRKTAAASSTTGFQSGRAARAGRPRTPIQTQRARRYTSGGYARGTLAKMFPSLKYQSETENDSSASRSRFRSDSGLRKSASPSKKATQKASQTGQELIFLPPNAPS